MSIYARSKRRPWILSSLVGVALGLSAAAPVWSGNVGSVSVMDPEEVGDGALRARAKAQLRSEDGVSDGGGKIITGEECGDVNVGNVVSSKVGGQVKNTVIIEGSVFNECR
jgi:ABC-type taurine transport system substrate-binding protein